METRSFPYSLNIHPSQFQQEPLYRIEGQQQPKLVGKEIQSYHPNMLIYGESPLYTSGLIKFGKNNVLDRKYYTVLAFERDSSSNKYNGIQPVTRYFLRLCTHIQSGKPCPPVKIEKQTNHTVETNMLEWETLTYASTN